MVINTTTTSPSGNARHFVLTSAARLIARGCRPSVMPSFILALLGGHSGVGVGTGRLALAVVRPQQWDMAGVTFGSGQRMAPITAQGYGRSAPIARRC